MLVETLTFRRIELPGDAARVVAWHADACRATFGDAVYRRRLEHPDRYLKNLSDRIEEYPEGHLLALAGPAHVGQMELQVPYGLEVGYVNLFYVAPEFRRRGCGRGMHARAEQYFRSWEARRIELHVSPTNPAAVRFYEAMGYGVIRREGELLRMGKDL